MKVLALDTSTEVLSLCGSNGKHRFALTRDVDVYHAQYIIPLMELILENLGFSPEELDLVVAARGPGSFTGLRIGLSTAKGLAAGAGCPCVFVPSLDLYASTAVGPEIITLPAIDAKKKRFYTALYRNGRRLGDYYDAPPEKIAHLLAEHPQVILTGPHGEDLFPLLVASRKGSEGILLDPEARRGRGLRLLQMGLENLAAGRTDAPDTGPLYIRPPEARPGGGPSGTFALPGI